MARSLKPLAMQDLLNRILDGTILAIGVYDVGSPSIVSGQVLDVGTSAGTLATAQACREVIVQSDSDNGTKVMSIGHNGTSTPIDLASGASITLPVNNVNLVYIKCSAGTGTANWLAVRDLAP